MQEILQTTADTYLEILKSSKKVSKAPKLFFLSYSEGDSFCGQSYILDVVASSELILN